MGGRSRRVDVCGGGRSERGGQRGHDRGISRKRHEVGGLEEHCQVGIENGDIQRDLAGNLRIVGTQVGVEPHRTV